jgi:dTDP-4-dehydrorhamnose reductase
MDSTKQKVLLLGGNGALGRELTSQLKAFKIPFLSTNRVDFNIEKSEGYITEMLLRNSITLVLNCVAMTGLDKCFRERKNALNINYIFPKKISKICEYLNIDLVQFSTDNVFSCDKEGYVYKDDDIPNPVTWYGVTKYLGELAVHASGKTIVRLPMMFGPTNDKQLIAKLIINATQGGVIRVASDVFTTPIYTPEVAKWICRKINDKKLCERNIIHLSGDTLTSLSYFISSLLERLNSSCKIVPVLSETFPVLESKSKFGGLKSSVDYIFSLNDSVISYSNFLIKE